jgi:hypothetical protein
MSSRSDDGNRKLGIGGIGESDLSGESFIFFWVVVTETNLKFYCFSEFSFLTGGNHFSEGFLEELLIDFTKN